MWKLGFDVRHLQLNEHEQRVLQLAAHGLPLATLCEHIAQDATGEDPTAAVFATLRQWLANGFLLGSAAAGC